MLSGGGLKRRDTLWGSIDLSKRALTVSKKSQDWEEISQDKMLEINKHLLLGERHHIEGVISVKIKSVSIDQGLLSIQESFNSLYCCIQHRNFQKRTTIVRDNMGKVKFEQVKHFPVIIVTNRSHPFNLLRIDIIGIGQNAQENRIGGVLFHMHDVIRGTPLSREFAIAGVNLIVGRINLELTFNYGSFGYGMSRQLLDEDYPTDELIHYCLLPRINPDPADCEANGYILRTQAVPHPSFIPFEKKVFLSYGQDLQPQLEALGAQMEPRPSFEGGMAKTEAVRTKYFSMEDRSTRIQWLHKYLQKSHQREEVVSEPVKKFEEEEFPSKNYIRFLSPVSCQAERNMAENLRGSMKDFKESLDQKRILRSLSVDHHFDSPATFMQSVQKTFNGIFSNQS